MNFVKLSTKFWCDDDLTCSFAARGLFCSLVSYCGDLLTDGKLTAKALLFIRAADMASEFDVLLAELVADGLIVADGDGFEVVNYKKRQTSKAQVQRKQKASAASSRRSRASSKRDVSRDATVTEHAQKPWGERDDRRDFAVTALEVEEETEPEVEEEPGRSPVVKARFVGDKCFVDEIEESA